MSKYWLILLLFSFTIYGLHAAPQRARARRVQTAPTIDGHLNDKAWKKAVAINDFTQYQPQYGASPSFPTEVKLVYDDKAVYVYAHLYDSSPDSIEQQLGSRDDWLNADYFSIRFDTYNNHQDAYIFEISASGVQRDRRRCDWTYSAVWNSAVQITDDGWCVEMRIPYSAIRFPKVEIQKWGLQISRTIRRYRESDHWALEEQGVPNNLVNWGILKGIEAINAPLRLALTPYVSAAVEHYPQAGESGISTSVSGGMDIKYGLDESFTLDMSLLPDFSQVKSDNPVKNLSAFETVHAEQRPFFKESMDLFRRGGLFYSRRIGKTPRKFNSVSDELAEGEKLVENPSRSKLLNATKISGRNKNGLALGFLNAVTNNTYAGIENEDGERRKTLTEPLTNFNIMVLDKAMKHNSSFYLINTSVIRAKEYENANVTGSGLNLFTRDNSFKFHISGAFSQKYGHSSSDNEQSTDQQNPGFAYHLWAGKVSGKFNYSLYYNLKNDSWDINDMGLTQRNNEANGGLHLNYKIFQPVGQLRNFSNYFNLYQTANHNTGKNINTELQYGLNATTLNYLHFWYRMNYSALTRYDYYDPREEGRYIQRPRYVNTTLGVSTDYRKKVAIDSDVWLGYDWMNYRGRTLSIRPRFRLSNKLSLNYNFKLSSVDNSKGYVGKEDESIIYGNRNLSTFENALSSRFIIRNNLSLSLWMRHYWYRGEYNHFYALEGDGELAQNPNYNGDHDFNFNSFNLDLTFGWQFAPGSKLNVVWKNAIVQDSERIMQNFMDNFSRTFEEPQQNILSFKLLYYLDYQSLEKQKTSNNGNAV